MNRAYDLDGIIAKDLDTRLDRIMLKIIPFIWANLRHLFVKCIKNDFLDPLVIVTGRPVCDKVTTELWLWLHDIEAKVYYNRFGIKNAIQWKVHCIQALEIDDFIESNKSDYEEILKQCPLLRPYR
jgi:hypothetical protein